MSDEKILDLLNIGIIILDNEYTITFSNEWVFDHLSESKIDIVGRNFNEIFNDSSNSSLEENLRDAVTFGFSSVLSSRLNSKMLKFTRFKGSKDQIPVKLLISPFKKNDDDPQGAIIQVVDNSQVIDRENFLVEQGEILDIERERTSNASRLASLGEMAGGIAHEINNPLAIIKGSVSILKKEFGKVEFNKEKIEKHIKKLDLTTERIAKIIIGIRNISRSPSSDEVELTTMGDILKDVLNIFSEKLKIHAINFKIDFEQAGLKLEIRLLKLLFYQVFINLINNSYDEIAENSDPWMQVEVFDDGDNLKILFTDSGNGIPKEVAKDIFVPFFTTKDVGKGTGLGLSTIFKIIEAHKGEISIDHDCLNTRFVIIIPKNLN